MVDEKPKFVKRVDESWKEEVEKERTAAPQEPAAAPSGESTAQSQAGGAPPPADFSFFLSTLSMQAMVALGELPNPATQQTQADLDQAKYLIDLLGVLQEKTRGNLTAEENQMLEGLLYELRMKYVAKTQGESA